MPASQGQGLVIDVIHKAYPWSRTIDPPCFKSIGRGYLAAWRVAGDVNVEKVWVRLGLSEPSVRLEINIWPGIVKVQRATVYEG